MPGGTAARILVVDDEVLIQRLVSNVLRKEGYDVEIAGDGEAGLQKVRSAPYDLALVDIRLPKLDGISLLRMIREEAPEIDVIVITAHSSVASAVEALRLGAQDYFTKPLKMDDVRAVIARCLRYRRTRRENVLLKRELARHAGAGQIITQDAKMAQILGLIEKVAAADSTVLIQGESGTGKELVAHAIHGKSARAGNPFTVANCAAMPETLLESELFGHEKGSFTGAIARKSGIFEVAERGTLFLDEVADMSPSTQSKLLRVLETGSFRRVGGENDISVDVRVLAATNKDLQRMIQMGEFRDDLYYRLNVVNVEMPPLREHADDIPLLARHFIENSSVPGGRGKRLSEEALRRLVSYRWPGNVRELENAIERAVILSDGEEIQPSDLPISVKGHDEEEETAGAAPLIETDPAGEPVTYELKEVEKQYILRALDAHNGHKQKTARALGIDPKTLYRKLKSYGM